MTKHTNLTKPLREYKSDHVSHDTLIKWGEFNAQRAYKAAVNEAAKQAAERQAAEDDRANHRNLNRMLTLFGALLIGLIVTFILTNPTAVLIPLGVSPTFIATMAPYTFTITILLDSSLALYSYVRKY